MAYTGLISPGRGLIVPLYLALSVVGNGADTTEDTLQSFTLPGGTLKNVGDRLLICASGALTSSTDNKTVRAKINGLTVSSDVGSAVGQASWSFSIWLAKTGATKTGATTHQVLTDGGVAGQVSAPLPRWATITLTDTSNIPILITGQNATTATANTITCNYFSVDYFRNG